MQQTAATVLQEYKSWNMSYRNNWVKFLISHHAFKLQKHVYLIHE
jgi:hypothetical protein